MIHDLLDDLFVSSYTVVTDPDAAHLILAVDRERDLALTGLQVLDAVLDRVLDKRLDDHGRDHY